MYYILLYKQTEAMKIVDNFELIKKLIEKRPCNSDQFYFVQVLVRGKDGHLGEAGINGNNKNRMTKYYTICSVDDLMKHEKEMKGISELVNGRVYIHPARRSFKKVANKMLLEFAQMVNNESYRMTKAAFSTAAGKVYDERVYIVDIDDVDPNDQATIDKYIDLILDCSADRNPDRIIAVVPTVHGFHLLCEPFNTKQYADTIGKPIDDCVKKNNPTLLYYKSLEGTDELTPEILERNGFDYDKESDWATYRTFVELNGMKEIGADIFIDFEVPVASHVTNNYVVEHDGYSPTLNTKEYTGTINTVSDLNSIKRLVGIDKQIE